MERRGKVKVFCFFYLDSHLSNKDGGKYVVGDGEEQSFLQHKDREKSHKQRKGQREERRERGLTIREKWKDEERAKKREKERQIRMEAGSQHGKER